MAQSYIPEISENEKHEEWQKQQEQRHKHRLNFLMQFKILTRRKGKIKKATVATTPDKQQKAISFHSQHDVAYPFNSNSLGFFSVCVV